MSARAKERFIVTLRADGAKDHDEAVRQLRAFLKVALRQWGFRCECVTGKPSQSDQRQDSPPCQKRPKAAN